MRTQAHSELDHFTLIHIYHLVDDLVLVTSLREKGDGLVLEQLRLFVEKPRHLLGGCLLVVAADSTILVTPVEIGRNAPHKEVPLTSWCIAAVVHKLKWVHFFVESLLQALAVEHGHVLTLLDEALVVLLDSLAFIVQQLKDIIDSAHFLNYIDYLEPSQARGTTQGRQYVALVGAISPQEVFHEVLVRQSMLQLYQSPAEHLFEVRHGRAQEARRRLQKQRD